MFWLAMRLTISTLLLLFAVSLHAQVPIHTEPEVFVTAIDIVADVRDSSGKVPAGLTIADFVVLEEGTEMELIGLEYLRQAATPVTPAAPDSSTTTSVPLPAARADWQVVIYFETHLTSSINRKRIADSLIKKVPELVRMGKVDVVLADPVPTSLLRDSRDPVAITAALKKAGNYPGASWLTSHRRDYYVTKMLGNAFTTTPARIVLPYVEEEVRVLMFFRTSLLKWLSSYGRYSPRALIIAMEGFDLDPLTFYSDTVGIDELMTLQNFVDQAQLGDAVNRTGQALAAGGWTTISVPGSIGAGWIDDTAMSGVGRIRSYLITGEAQDLRPGPRSFVYRPLEPLAVMAEATGGTVVSNLGKLGAAIDGLSDRIKLTYQVARPPDAKVRNVVVRARRPDLKVSSMRWATSTTPEQMSEARALALLGGGSGGPGGNLAVDIATDWDESVVGRRKGKLRLTSNIDSAIAVLPGQSRVLVRVTFAIQVEKKSAFLLNRLVTDYGAASGPFKYSAPLEIPDDAGMIVVVVEEINTGIWGYARLSLKKASS
jgi:hypothetical protein